IHIEHLQDVGQSESIILSFFQDFLAVLHFRFHSADGHLVGIAHSRSAHERRMTATRSLPNIISLSQPYAAFSRRSSRKSSSRSSRPRTTQLMPTKPPAENVCQLPLNFPTGASRLTMTPSPTSPTSSACSWRKSE